MSSTARPKVAVVGAGYAGMTAVRRLGGRADVVLINPSESFIDRIRLHEYVAGTSARAGVALPIAPHLPSGARLIVDHAVAVSPGSVTLASGTQIRADHVVVAIGSGARGGIGTIDGAADIRRRLDEQPGARVLIRGAGHTGTEVAAEIAAARPDLMLTLSDPAGLLQDLSAKAQGKAEKFLLARNVRVNWSDIPELDQDHDIVIDCTGLAVPALSGLARPDHHLRTADGLWVCGDAASVGLRMSCAAAEPMGAHVADSILRIANGETLKPFSLGFVNHVVSLGRHDGILQLVHRDDRPRRLVVTGRPGAWVKELIKRMARRVALRSPQRYRWPSGKP